MEEALDLSFDSLLMMMMSLGCVYVENSGRPGRCAELEGQRLSVFRRNLSKSASRFMKFQEIIS